MTRALVLMALALWLIGLGWLVRRSEAARTGEVAERRERQRKAVATARPLVAAPAAPAGKPRCVQGVDGFATAVERQIAPLASGARRLESLLRISDLALVAERRAELARPAPTLPKRMGSRDEQPLAPVAEACGGKGFAELHGE